MYQILGKIMMLLIVLKTKYQLPFFRNLNVSLEHEQGYPVIKAKHPKIGFLVTSFK
jgi:hypothetical protein